MCKTERFSQAERVVEVNGGAQDKLHVLLFDSSDLTGQVCRCKYQSIA